MPLYSLGELDAASTKASYEQFFMRLWSYDTVGFRFDVDDVFKRLVAAVQANVPANMLGNDTPDQWVRDSHPCVKVRIMSGEKPNNYTPWGGVPDDRCEPAEGPPHRPAQPGALRHDADGDKAADVEEVHRRPGRRRGERAVAAAHAAARRLPRPLSAIPRAAYERYIDPKTSKGGAVRGFEGVRG